MKRKSAQACKLAVSIQMASEIFTDKLQTIQTTMEMGEEEKKVRKAILLRILEKQNLNRSSSSVHHQKPKMKTLTRMQTKKVETTKKNNDDHKLLQCAVGGLNLSRHNC